MINKTACREVLEFLDAIEGQGYGGMASFETARLHARIALEMAAQQDGGWQPIETAPKGEIVLVSGMTRLADDTLVGPNVSMAEQHEDGIWSADDYDQEALDPQPTHWMPLPAPRRT